METNRASNALSVEDSIRIAAPARQVWLLVKDFGALQAWHPAIEAGPADQGNTIGSMRRLAIKGGGALVETLEEHDDAAMRFTYRAADGGALPVTGYRSTVQVLDDGDGAQVRWNGSFSAAPGASDDSALVVIRSVYRTGLEHLKRLCEGGG